MPLPNALRSDFAALEESVMKACAEIAARGEEPFLEFVYGDDGLATSVVIRARRPEDQDGTAKFRWFTGD